jgi:hypothetical protein
MLLVPRYCRRDYICYKEVKVSKGLKYTFLVHAILGTIMALGFLFIPNKISDWYGTTSFDPGLARLLGASVLAVSVSSWLSFGAKEVQQVRITAPWKSGLLLFLPWSHYTIFFSGILRR